MIDRALIALMSDRGTSIELLSETDDPLILCQSRAFAFDLHWLHEAGLGALTGDLGLRVGVDATVPVRYELAGSFRRVISIDDQRRLRIRVYKRPDRKYQFLSRVSVHAEATEPLTGTIDELATALLGVHEHQWLMDLRHIPGKAATRIPGVTRAALCRFREAWARLAPEARAAIWKRAGEPPKRGKSGGNPLPALDRSSRTTLIQLRRYALDCVCPDAIARGLQSLAGFRALDDWVKLRLEGVLGPVRRRADVAGLRVKMRAVLRLRDSIRCKAAEALECRLAAELSRSYHSAGPHTELLDCSFDPTEEGSRQYQRALSGDWAGLLATPGKHVKVSQGLLCRPAPSTPVPIELHLPYMRRKGWASRLDFFPGMEVACDGGGRVVVSTSGDSQRAQSRNAYQATLALAGGLPIGQVHSASSFTLAYENRSRLKTARVRTGLVPLIRGYGFDKRVEKWLESLPPGEEDLEVSLALSVPGTMATAWLNAPGASSASSASFFQVNTRVSTAVQRAIRRWLPYVYFDVPDRYDDLTPAFPLIVYQVSPLCRPRPNNDFTYDVLRADTIPVILRRATPRLSRELVRLGRILAGSGIVRGRKFYRQRQAVRVLSWVRRSRRFLESLLAAEGGIVNAFVNLGCMGAGLPRKLAMNPKKGASSLTTFVEQFVKALQPRLRRLYAAQDHLPFGSLLLVEATYALHKALGGAGGIHAVLRVRRGEAGQPGSVDATFVNRCGTPG